MLRASMVAAVLALTHVGSAVILAVAALPLVTRTLAGVGRAPALEMVSRTLLTGIGVWLIIRALRTRPHLHGEGVTVGFVGGLVPCPLTLFVMVFAVSRKVPEAGLIFAAAMMLGVLLTLSAVALVTVIGRDWLLRFLGTHGSSIDWMTRGVDALAGLLLVGLSLHELAR